MTRQVGWYWKERNSSFGGYAGLKFTADKIKEFIPTSKIYVEPFAGLGRTVESKHDKVILNDMSDYAVNYLKSHFPYAQVTQEDFIECIKKHDSEDTFFLIDPPWFDREYTSNNLSYCDMKAQKYYDILAELLPIIKGNWFVLSKAHTPRTKDWKYNKVIIESEKNVLFGKKAKTLIVSNIHFKQEGRVNDTI